MSERAEKLYDGITGISDQIVERAEGYAFPKRRKKYYGLAAWGTVAACACLIVMVTLPHLASGGSSDSSLSAGMAETEKAEAPTTQVMEDKEVCQDATTESGMTGNTASDFGGLFPQLLLAGYEPSQGICIYDGEVLIAKYFNAELSDEMSIRIAHRDWFVRELGKVETDVIFYGENAESYIYIAGGDYIAEYAFCNRDIAKIADFYDMVTSSPCFAGQE